MTSNDLTLSELCCERNPYPGRDDVATRRDVFEGARLIAIGYGKLARAEVIDVVLVLRHEDGSESIRTRSGYEYPLADLGIVPYGGDNWSKDFITFRNLPEMRKSIAEWLDSQGGAGRKSVRLLRRIYRYDFLR